LTLRTCSGRVPQLVHHSVTAGEQLSAGKLIQQIVELFKSMTCSFTSWIATRRTTIGFLTSSARIIGATILRMLGIPLRLFWKLDTWSDMRRLMARR
jgi:hypothetical protein